MAPAHPHTPTLLVDLLDVQRAHERIAPYIRNTPVLDVGDADIGSLSLKLEFLQQTGSFKVRGALNAALTLPETALRRGLVTASGGNHGLGVAFAGQNRGVQTTVFLPASAPDEKVDALARWGASVHRVGEVWDDADAAARAFAEERGAMYVHPFANPAVVAGQGTVALELLAALDIEPDVLVIPIGGGGLIAGMAIVARAVHPGMRIVGVEPVGAPTLHASLQQGEPIVLDRIETAANTLAPKTTARLNFDIIRTLVDEVVLVTDDALRSAQQWLWDTARIPAELSAAASTAAVREGLIVGERVAGIACGASRPA